MAVEGIAFYDDVTWEPGTAGDISGKQVRPAHPTGGLVYYILGGGFTHGSSGIPLPFPMELSPPERSSSAANLLVQTLSLDMALMAKVGADIRLHMGKYMILTYPLDLWVYPEAMTAFEEIELFLRQQLALNSSRKQVLNHNCIKERRSVDKHPAVQFFHVIARSAFSSTRP